MQALPEKESNEACLVADSLKTQAEAKASSPEKKPDIAKLPPIDITNLDLEQLRPVGKDDYDLVGTKVCLNLGCFLVIPICLSQLSKISHLAANACMIVSAGPFKTCKV